MYSKIRAESSPLPSNEQSSTLITSLPEDIILDILAGVPRCDYPTVSLVSKHFRSLVSSPEIYERRSSLRCTERCHYVVLSDHRLYTLHRKANGKRSRLVLIPWLPAMPHNGTYAAVGSRVYVFGGKKKHDLTLSAFSIDCRSHIVQRLPNMPVPMPVPMSAYYIVDIIDGRINIIGQPCGFQSTVVKVVFNTKTQMWEPGMTKLDPEDDYMWKDRDVAMGLKNSLVMYDFEQRCWEFVYGLEEFMDENPTITSQGCSKTVSYGEKLVLVFTTGKVGYMGETREICCAEISVEVRRADQSKYELWYHTCGKVEWCDRGLIAGDFNVLKSFTVMV